ncbi:MAG: hypothetical protein WC674_02620 [Candidatus Krumholzibacteriia bacterium]
MWIARVTRIGGSAVLFERSIPDAVEVAVLAGIAARAESDSLYDFELPCLPDVLCFQNTPAYPVGKLGYLKLNSMGSCLPSLPDEGFHSPPEDVVDLEDNALRGRNTEAYFSCGIERIWKILRQPDTSWGYGDGLCARRA